MTVSRFSEGLWDDYLPKRQTFYFETLNILHKSKFCPLCLQESGYHQIHWEIGKLSICLKHKSKLIGKCYNC